MDTATNPCSRYRTRCDSIHIGRANLKEVRPLSCALSKSLRKVPDILCALHSVLWSLRRSSPSYKAEAFRSNSRPASSRDRNKIRRPGMQTKPSLTHPRAHYCLSNLDGIGRICRKPPLRSPLFHPRNPYPSVTDPPWILRNTHHFRDGSDKYKRDYDQNDGEKHKEGSRPCRRAIPRR